MKKLILVAALIAGGCSYALAQGAGSSGGGQGTSGTPSITQDPKQGTMREDNPAKKTVAKKSKKMAKKKM
jgi:uncharacterized protein YdeI (BOF family)